MAVFKINDEVVSFSGAKGIVTKIESKMNKQIHKYEPVTIITVLVNNKEVEYYYRDLKHII